MKVNISSKEFFVSFIAEKINGQFFGDSNRKITNIGTIDSYNHESLICVFSSNFLKNFNISTPACFVFDKGIGESIEGIENFILVEDINLAFASLTSLFLANISTPKKIEKSSCQNTTTGENVFVGKNVSIGRNVVIGENVVIEDNSVIGDGTKIGHSVTIHHNSIIGKNVEIQSGSVIGSEGFGNFLDENNNWVHINHIGNVIIEDKVLIGSNCSIDRGTIGATKICTGVIIDNLVHIAHNNIIGENTAIAAKVGIAGSCKIGKRNLIGGMVGIIDHITTANDVTISAKSTVTKNILEPGVYTGIMPILVHSKWKRVATLLSKLDKISKFFKNNQ